MRVSTISALCAKRHVCPRVSLATISKRIDKETNCNAFCISFDSNRGIVDCKTGFVTLATWSLSSQRNKNSHARLGRRTHCQVMRDGKILAAGGSAFANARAMCLRRRIVQPMPLKV